MTKRMRHVLAACAAFVGAAVLGFWFYARIVTDSVVGMIEATGLHPQTSETVVGRILPYLGIALILGSLALLALPLARRMFGKADK